MRVLIAGGGTGGHLFPGLAVAEEFKRREAATEVVFVGTESGIESRIVPKEGYPIRYVRAEGIVGLSLAKKVKAIVKAGVSIIDGRRIMKAVKPDIVIGVGGYASGAVVFLAYLLSVPTMILEQNAVPGITNRILGKFVDIACITHQESMSFFPKGRTFLTGNPVRLSIFKGDAEAGYRVFSLDHRLFTILAFGGSAGASSINRALVDSLQNLLDLRDKVQFLHQTGPKDYEAVRHAYQVHGFRGTIAPFVYQMGDAYAVADLVIARAGATTLAELTAIGKPCILIPYPFAAGNHQELNALKLQEIGAAKMIPDRELSGELLAKYIRDLFGDEAGREQMQKTSRAVGRPDAHIKVVDIAMSLTKHSVNSDSRPTASRRGRDNV